MAAELESKKYYITRQGVNGWIEVDDEGNDALDLEHCAVARFFDGDDDLKIVVVASRDIVIAAEGLCETGKQVIREMLADLKKITH